MTHDGYLASSYRKQRVIGPLHTGGPVVVTADAKRVVTCLDQQAILTDVDSGQEICRLYNDTTSVTAIALSPSEKNLVVITASLSMRVYAFPSLYTSPLDKPLEPIRHIPKAHDAPVHVVAISPDSLLVATGSADGVVKVWDLHRGYVTHVFKGHGGVISCLAFHPSPVRKEDEAPPSIILATGSVDTKVRLFDLGSSGIRSSSTKPIAVLDDHVSVPRGIAFSSDGKRMLTAGRDSVVLVWQLGASGKKNSKSKTSADITPILVKTIPVSEAIEALGIITMPTTLQSQVSSASLLFFIGGERGAIGIWDALDGKLLKTSHEHSEQLSDDAQELKAIQEAIYAPTASVVISIHADQNIVFHSLPDLSISRQLIGFNDEIVDAVYLSHPASGSRDSHLALATNSSLLRIYSTSAGAGLDSRLLDAHTDTVLALDCSPDGTIIVSGGKDKTIRIWSPVTGSAGKWACTAVGTGHTESVGALGLSRKSGQGMPKFVVSGSQDRTVKLWDLASMKEVVISNDTDSEPQRTLQSLITQKVHDKDVNSLDISPNDGLLVTGSQDKTAKVFEIKYQQNSRATLTLLGILKGHKRGIWNVKFSKTEKVIATASGDKAIKLWSLDDFSCVKTFEGHTNSVLRVEFINQGLQLLSTASDGLLKLWNVRGEECVATMDNHEDKVWALAVNNEQNVIATAAADSVITFWEDSTESEKREKDEKREALVAKEQDFVNYLHLQDYKNAIFLALSMDHPRRLYNLFSAVTSARAVEPLFDSETGAWIEDNGQTTAITGNPAVDEVIRTLPSIELSKLLRHVRDWNTAARTSAVAQVILHAIIKLRSAADIHTAFSHRSSNSAGNNGDQNVETVQGESLRDVIDALIPYTERHLARTDRLVQESYALDLLLSEMDDGVGRDDDLMQLDGSYP